MSELKVLMEQFLKRTPMPQNLCGTTDWGTLVQMWKDATSGLVRIRIEWHMHRVLLGVSDIDELIRRRQDAPSDSLRTVLENRLAEVLPGILPNITEWRVLKLLSRNVHPDSRAAELIADRMAEVLPSILPHVNDWHLAFGKWKDAPDGSRAEAIARDHMGEMIFSVSLDEMPEWFREYLKTPESLPPCPHLQMLFRKKVQFLYAGV